MNGKGSHEAFTNNPRLELPLAIGLVNSFIAKTQM